MSRVADWFGVLFLLAVVGMLVTNQNSTNAITSFTTALTSLIGTATGGNSSNGTSQGGTTQ